MFPLRTSLFHQDILTFVTGRYQTRIVKTGTICVSSGYIDRYRTIGGISVSPTYLDVCYRSVSDKDCEDRHDLRVERLYRPVPHHGGASVFHRHILMFVTGRYQTRIVKTGTICVSSGYIDRYRTMGGHQCFTDISWCLLQVGTRRGLWRQALSAFRAAI